MRDFARQTLFVRSLGTFDVIYYVRTLYTMVRMYGTPCFFHTLYTSGLPDVYNKLVKCQ